jgi:flagellar motility protein MotE (MotC chaperone)
VDYRTLDTMRRAHPAWRLLTADSAPLVISFLYRNFVQPNLRTLPRQELASRLDDDLYHLREQLGDTAFPRPAVQYLDDWASDDRAWLRKYYPADSDEPHYDITPATEKAINWLASLEGRQFVGTESRLMTVFELLRQMVEGTTLDPETRIAELEKRKAQLDADIHGIRQGYLSSMDDTQVKERFLHMASTARELLSDFREVDHNFRELDRDVRERIATWEESRGALLDEIFDERDAIESSDQGKSFRAFWDFLMSAAHQEELSNLLNAVFQLKPVQALEPDRRLLRIHYDWLNAGDVAQRTVARLSEQLRRYLDDQAWLENKRIMQLLRDVEQHAIAIRAHFPDGPPMELDEPAPDIDLAMDRPLFTPPFKPTLTSRAVLAGNEDVPADALFEQIYVDKTHLAAHIRRALQTRPQISLMELVDSYPLEHGLAELITYLSLAAEDRMSVIDDTDTQIILWTDDTGTARQATVPLVIFSRHVGSADIVSGGESVVAAASIAG